MSDFSEKVAVVTGGSRGIGLAITRGLARGGAKVAVVSRSEGSARGAVQKLEVDFPGQVKGYGVDVADHEAVQEMGKLVLDEFGAVNILVNNAGVTRDGLLMRMKSEDWDSVLDTNLKGAFNLVKAFQRSLMKAVDPRIINISSVIGLIGNAGQANYAASKAGLIGFTKSVARELSGRKVTCNAIAPGFITSDMTDELSEEIRAEILKKIPLGEMGKPEEVAALVCYLASREAAYITGQVIAIDGGMTM